jgi:GT2 family glycosyltransferase
MSALAATPVGYLAMSLTTAIVLSYQSAAHLESCFSALVAQTRPPDQVILVDNGSTDGGPELVRARHPGVEVVLLGENVGYAAAHDKALARARCPLVLFLNPDCRLEPDYLERLQETLARDEDVAAAQGKLLKHDASGGALIDSTGIVLTRSRRNFDRGEGEPDRGQHDAPGEVFGVTGAAALWRREALDDVAISGEPLDASYWMYREDLDLAWRARLLGWRFLYDPRAVAWHARGFGRGDRARVPRALRHASLRNRYLTIWKNDDALGVLRDLPWLVPFEAAQAAWVLVRDPALLLAYADAALRLPGALAKRRAIQGRRTVGRAEIARWLVRPREAGTVL